MAPSLFNIYLEEALRSERTLSNLIGHGKLLAYADDLVVLNRNKQETEEMIRALGRMGNGFNLHLNKKKCEILKIKDGDDDIEEIEGIQVQESVRYLGLKIMRDP